MGLRYVMADVFSLGGGSSSKLLFQVDLNPHSDDSTTASFFIGETQNNISCHANQLHPSGENEQKKKQLVIKSRSEE